MNSRPRHEIVTPALLLLGPVSYTLRLYDYPLFRKEVLLVVSVTAIVGLLVGWIIHRASLPLRLIVLALLLTVVCDLYFIGGSFSAGLLLFVVIGLVVWALRAHVTTAAFVVAVAALASTILVHPFRAVAQYGGQPTGASRSAQSAIPPVFHIILDGSSGMAGLADDTVLTRDITELFRRRGFRWFPNAYSSYFDTSNSIPGLVNLTIPPTDSSYVRRRDSSALTVRGNPYLDTMRSRGYALRIYQSSYLDFCSSVAPSISSCFTYPFSSLSYASKFSLSTSARARLIATYVLAERSYLFTRTFREYDVIIRPQLVKWGIAAPLWKWANPQVGVAPSLVFERLESDVADGSAGTLFFVHLLLPHGPYQFDAQCRAHEQLSSWLSRNSPEAPVGDINTAASRTLRRRQYGEQVRCVMRTLEEFFVKLDQLGVYESAIIVLNGDHGNRITINPIDGANAYRLTRQDLLDTYSTLFAVKAPAIDRGPDTATVNIIDIFRSLLLSGFRSTELDTASRRGEPTVLLVNEPNKAMIPLAYPDPADHRQ